MIFLRKGVRTVDVSIFDSRYVTLPLIWTVSIVMTIKKVACLSIQSWTLITVINLVSFGWEVTNRITVVKRDMAMDRWIWGEKSTDLSPPHKQLYIHAEIVSEIFELAYPIPIGVLLYMIQFSPSGVPPAGVTIVYNVVQQIVVEMLADCVAIFYKSRFLQ